MAEHSAIIFVTLELELVSAVMFIFKDCFVVLFFSCAGENSGGTN